MITDLDDYKHDPAKEHNSYRLVKAWAECTSPILRVTGEDGDWPEHGAVRHYVDDIWLYVDDVDGYKLIPESDVKNMADWLVHD